MERKGITPVVAIVLLMMITVGGAGVVYEAFSNTQDQASSFQPDLQLSDESLSIESCWNETATELKLSIRNQASATINASNIPFRVESKRLEFGSGYGVNQELVDPRDTFIATLDRSQPFTSETLVSIITSEDTIEYKCFKLPGP